MTIAEILLQDYDIEMAGIRTTLERIPETNPEFKCHNKSMPMGRLAVHVSTLPRFGFPGFVKRKTGTKMIEAFDGWLSWCNRKGYAFEVLREFSQQQSAHTRD